MSMFVNWVFCFMRIFFFLWIFDLRKDLSFMICLMIVAMRLNNPIPSTMYWQTTRKTIIPYPIHLSLASETVIVPCILIVKPKVTRQASSKVWQIYCKIDSKGSVKFKQSWASIAAVQMKGRIFQFWINSCRKAAQNTITNLKKTKWKFMRKTLHFDFFIPTVNSVKLLHQPSFFVLNILISTKIHTIIISMM